MNVGVQRTGVRSILSSDQTHSSALAIPIIEVARRLGLETIAQADGGAFIKCPFTAHRKDSLAEHKCQIGGKLNIAHCHDCGESADTIGLVRKVREADYVAALEWLTSEFDLFDLPKLSRHRRDASSPSDSVAELAHVRGWNPDALRAMGAKAGTGRDSGCVIIPMFDDAAVVCGHRKRRGDGRPFKVRQKGKKALTVKGGNVGLMRPEPFPAEGTIIVVEGEADAAAALSAGWPGGAVIATPGAGAGVKILRALARLTKGRNVVMAPHPGAPGSTWRQKVGRALTSAQGRVRVILPEPGEGDLDDRLRTADDPARALCGLAARAVPWRDDAGAGEDGELVIDPEAPLPAARAFVERMYTHNGLRTLRRHDGAFLVWNGVCYRERTDEDLRARIYAFAETGRMKDGAPFEPNSRRVSDLLDAVKGLVNLPADTPIPSWLRNSSAMPPPSDLLVCKNGVLQLSTGKLMPATPEFFSVNAVNYAFDEHAPEPSAWFDFLRSLWGDDAESIGTLQDWAGYLLTPDTHFQKILLLLGPKRSGKGTIGRVLSELVGEANVCAPTFASLATNFGPSALIHKRLGIIADARLSGRTDQGILVERLLSISGEDPQTIDRKYRNPWNGRLQVRFMILTNELPRLRDAAGALASRFIVLRLTESFLGREDHGLAGRLLTELPGILNWSIGGLHGLRERGRFVQPESSAETVTELQRLGSPIAAFLDDRCNIGVHFSVVISVLFKAWKDWCTSHGDDNPGTPQTFGAELRSALLSIKETRPRTGGARERRYVGVGLR